MVKGSGKATASDVWPALSATRMIKTKSIYDAASDSDGLRVLVTRFWPRGVKKEAVDLWVRDAAPDAGDIKLYKAGKLKWPEFKRLYTAGLKAPERKRAVEALKGEIKACGKRPVTLLCTCREEGECHRSLLKSALSR